MKPENKGKENKIKMKRERIMIMKKNQVVAGILASAMLLSVAGCKSGNDKQIEIETSLPKGEVSYPIKEAEGKKLTFWKTLTAGVAAIAESENDLQFSKWLKEDTGIEVEFIHPPAGQDSEKFNLMLASGELPDIVQYNLSNTSEGAEQLIEKRYFAELSNEFLNDYAPNFAKKLSEDPELAKSAKLNNGNYYGFAPWRTDDIMTVYSGPIVRKDWLDDLGLSTPETMDDWHEMLLRFKNDKGATAPLTLSSTASFAAGLFSGAYGVKLDYYTNNGKVTHGIMEPEFKDFLTEMAKWYDEGLLDRDFASNSKEQTDTKMLTGKSGATYGLIGSGMGNLLSAASSEKYALSAAKYPSLQKGEKSEMGAKDSKYYEPCYLISSTCADKALAARFLDYGYSEKGGMLYNFGREGESYTMVEDFPTFTDLIYNNADGLSTTQALNMYTHCAYMGPTAMDVRFFKQQYQHQEQKDAIDVWADTNAKDHMLTIYNANTTEENSEMSKLITDLNTHIGENIVQFIMGVKPLSEFEQFVQELESMGMKKVIEIKQAAYDRYQSR